MRIYKPESTRPIPEGAKINREKKTVTYKGRNGETVKAVLTDEGKMRVSQGTWHIAFRDHLDRQQDLPAFEDEGDSNVLVSHIKNLVVWHGKPLPPDLQGYCDRLHPRIAALLAKLGLLEPKPEPQREPEKLTVWVDEFENWLKATKADSGYLRNENHIRTVIGRVRAIVGGCHFETWDSIKKQPIEIYLGEQSLSNRTHNGYIAAIKQLCQWVVDNDKAEFSPLAKLRRVKVPQKENRCPLSFEPFCRLLAAAQNGPVRHGLTGPQRAVLYLLAVETGLRRNELFHLTANCFNLTKATVKLGAAHCKNRLDADQPIRLALASRLVGFLEGKGPTDPLFNLKTPRTAQMIQEDALEAGLPLVDDEGRELVFHSLRHTLRTELVLAHVAEEIINAVMRHSPKGVGQQFYGHVTDFQKREALSRLPDYPWPVDLQQAAVKTGTDEAPVEIYGGIYAKDTSNKTASVSMRQVTPSGASETALLMQNQGLAQTSEPMVGGSSPSGRTQEPHFR